MTQLKKREGFVILAHPDKEVAWRVRQEMIDWLKARNQKVIEDESQALMAKFAIALGGDGMAVRTSAEYSIYGVITIPINAGGDVGFITIANRHNWSKALELIIAGKYQCEERISLEAIFNGQDYGPFVNDVVLKPLNSMGLFRVSTGKHIIYRELRSDGVIVAAPTGSTGWSLSAGGPVTEPGLECLLLTPLCADQVGAKPLVMRSDAVIEIQAVSAKSNTAIYVTADGVTIGELKSGEKIIVRQHQVRVLFAVIDHRDFYNALHRKKGLMR